MKKLFIFCLLTLSIGSAFAEAEESEYIPMKTAGIQIMNKQAGRVQSVAIPVEKELKFDKLEIVVRKCLGVNEFMPEDYFMFAEINKGGSTIFSGWMTRNEPGQNPLQDPDYDLWLTGCE
jgi:hypothetical protein